MGLTAQLTVAGLAIADRLRPHHQNVDVLKVGDVPVPPVPTVTADPTLSALPSPKVTPPSLPPLPSPSISLPVPIPTVSLPPLPHVPLPKCGDTILAEPPKPADDFSVPQSGDDASALRVDSGAAYFTETARDGNYGTSAVRLDLSTGRQTHSTEDSFFAFTDAGDGYAWGTDRDGVVALDPSSPTAAPRRWPDSDFVVNTPDGQAVSQPDLVKVDGSSAYVFGYDAHNYAVSRIDVDSGDVAWTVELPQSSLGVQGVSAGVRTVIGAAGGSVYVALPEHADGGDVVRIWRLTGKGEIAAQRDITADGADADTESLLSVTSDGVFATVPTGNSGNSMDATVFKLDPESLAPTTHVDIPVVEDLNAFGGVVWASTIQCNEFIWYRYSASDLHPVGRPWILPNMSYTVDGTSGEVWSLRTRNPMEPTDVVGYHF